MEENRETRFAVLIETDESFRLDPTVSVSGHAVLTICESQGDLSIYLKNLRPLRDAHSAGFFFYEGWLVDPNEGMESAVSLGAFNSDETGSAKSCLPFSADNLRGTDRPFNPQALLMVTAQQLNSESRPAKHRVTLGVFGPTAPIPALLDLRTKPEDETAARPEESRPDGSDEPAASPITATGAGASTATAPSAPSPWAFPDAPYPPLVCPSGYQPVGQTHEALVPLRDRIRQATGSATIDFDKGTVLLTIRGVPAPAFWGVEPTTARVFNVYEGWLHNSRTGEWASLGIFRKIWQDTFRLQYRGELPLHLYDTIVVAPEDRASSGDPARIPLFSAGYLPYEEIREPLEVPTRA